MIYRTVTVTPSLSENILSVNASVSSETVGVNAQCYTTVRGNSAYEIAVQHGFQGTEEEWLASLGVETATATTPGVMKIYDETGQNVDGTMTQRSITNTIADNTAGSISADELLEILS